MTLPATNGNVDTAQSHSGHISSPVFHVRKITGVWYVCIPIATKLDDWHCPPANILKLFEFEMNDTKSSSTAYVVMY